VRRKNYAEPTRHVIKSSNLRRIEKNYNTGERRRKVFFCVERINQIIEKKKKKKLAKSEAKSNTELKRKKEKKIF
jgi:hypothetical protein